MNSTTMKRKIKKEHAINETSSEMKFRSVFESANDAIILTNGKMDIIAWNRAAERVFGYKEIEVLGKTLDFIIPDRFKEAHKMGVNRYQTTGEARVIGKTVELYGKDRKNNEFPIELTLNTWMDGNELCFSAIIRDVTERKKAEELFINSEKLSIAGQLAAGIAHEIRNPLTAIKGFLKLLESEASDKLYYFDVISSEMFRIETIISELLVLAKPQATKLEEQNISHILSSVVTLFESQANLNNIQIIKDFQATNPLLECDENQIKQVFINFLKNSMEAMPDGGRIIINISHHELDHLLIRIIDEGIGIPKEVLAKLGEPFYSTKEKGTGLGMMVSKKIIKEHKGKINITSKVDKGTTIEVMFPISCEIT